MTDVIATLREHNPSLRSQVGHDGNDVFPLRGWASLFRDGASDEDLVISLDFQHVPQGVEWTADIATGVGEVLGSTPAETIAATDDLAALERSVRSAMDAVQAFLDANRHRLIARLRIAPS